MFLHGKNDFAEICKNLARYRYRCLLIYFLAGLLILSTQLINQFPCLFKHYLSGLCNHDFLFKEKIFKNFCKFGII